MSQDILKRSEHPATASNYSKSVDSAPWIKQLGSFGDGLIKAADYVSSLFNKKVIPTGQSNCMLTVSSWINPKTPISRSQTIIDNGKKYGYVEIPQSHMLPGDLLIATNPINNAHHAMLVHGFDKKDKPLVRYSSGTTHSSGYRYSKPLQYYIDNSNGKTNLQVFRYYEPESREILLPEITVTPNGNNISKNQKIIRIKR